MAIGIENNNLVGPHRKGPRNMAAPRWCSTTRSTPADVELAVRRALSGDPFDNGKGFLFPQTGGAVALEKPHLLVAQAFIRHRTAEMAGRVRGNNDDIRAEVVKRLNATPELPQAVPCRLPGHRADRPDHL